MSQPARYKKTKFLLKVIAAVLIASVSASILAALIFYAGPKAWQYLKTLMGIDWAKWFLWLYLFGYFLGAAQMWYHEFAHSLRYAETSRFYKFASLLIVPAFVPFSFVHTLMQGVLLLVCFNYLHEQSKAIALRSFNVLCLIWISIYSILLFSNLWQPTKDQCQWVFPRILTCLLTKHENLAGGLVGAGGTIFAAWVAWIAVQEQLKRSQQTADDAASAERGQKSW